MSAMTDLSPIPPLRGPDDFSLESLKAIREQAANLYYSGFLLIMEEFSMTDIIERCDEMIGQIASTHGH